MRLHRLPERLSTHERSFVRSGADALASPTRDPLRLVLRDGTTRGAVELGRPDWREGRPIYRGDDEPNLRVLDAIPSDDLETFACSSWSQSSKGLEDRGLISP